MLATWACSTIGATMISRQRLVDRLIDPAHSNYAIEAGGGFGKTVLLNQLRRASIEPVVSVRPPALRGDVLGFLSELADAANRSGDRELAATILGSEGNSQGIAEALIVSGAILILDDVDRWEVDAIELLSDIIHRLESRTRVVVAARTGLGPSDTLRSEGSWHFVGPNELIFTIEETASCLAEQSAPSEAAAVLCEATNGWPLAVALVAGRLGQTSDAQAVANELAGFGSTIDGLLAPYLSSFEVKDRDALAILATLPFFDDAIAAKLGANDLLQRVANAGVPVTRRADNWFEFPSQVRSWIRRSSPNTTSLPARVTSYLVDRGEIHAALNACLTIGAYVQAAQLIASLSNDQQTRLEPAGLNAAMTMIGEFADEVPRSLLVQAQVNGTFGHMVEGLSMLERAAANVQADAANKGSEVAIEIMLELGLWRVFQGDLDDARSLLSASEAYLNDNSAARLNAKAHDLRGVLFQTEGHADALEQAALEFSRSLKIWQSLAESRPAAAVVFRLAAGVLADLGQRSQALELLDNLPNVGPMTLINRARLGLERSLLLPYLGRAHEVAGALAEPRRIAAILGHEWLIGWSYWSEIIAASLLNDGGRVHTLVDEFEASGYHIVDDRTQDGMWCEVAEALARVGACERAQQVLSHITEPTSLPSWFVVYAQASVAARCGDVTKAAGLLDGLASDDSIDHDRLWRIDLLQALCSAHAGDTDQKERSLSAAASRVAEMGQPTLLEIVEAQLLSQIEGDNASESPPLAEAVVEITIFEDFSLTIDGAPTTAPRGHSTQLLKLLVLGQGQLVIDQIVDPLWPDATLVVGRRRLRNILARLREGCGDIVVRDGDTIRFASNVSSDYGRAQHAATIALKPDASLGSLRNALELNTRRLLPADRYEPWAEDARETHRRQLIALLDAQAIAAERAGDIDLTASALKAAAELDPFANDRLHLAAALLREHGRDAAAAALETPR